jgi:sugar O-acyltransferase (sialic acid O-acetyltransferase NeuD family)
MKILIYGSKEFAATVSELARHCGHEVAGMIDDINTGPSILGGLDIVAQKYLPQEYGVAIAIGYNNLAARWAVWKKIKAVGYYAPALIHPHAYVADSAIVGEGVMVMAGAMLDVRTTLGELAVVWPGVCVNHDSKIGANTFLSPSAIVCGATIVGSHVFVGAGVVIVDHVQVPDGKFVKAASCYIGDRIT